MADYEFKVIYTTSDKVRTITHKWGQLIFCKDTREIYSDDASERKVYGQIIVIATEAMRQALIPVTAFYFVSETNTLWRYDREWNVINEPPKEYIVFANRRDFPQEGNPNVLYIDGTLIYRYIDGAYQLMNGEAGSLVWDET
jgi:hypothetical protein